MEEDGLFSGLGATQGLESQAPFDFGAITESQLQSQVDFSFLDFAQTQDGGGGAFDDYALPQPSQVNGGCAIADLRYRQARRSAITRLPHRHRHCRSRRQLPLPLPHRRCIPAPQVPTFQPTQGDAALGLDTALSQLSFQDNVEAEAVPEEQPTELPEWACA